MSIKHTFICSGFNIAIWIDIGLQISSQFLYSYNYIMLFYYNDVYNFFITVMYSSILEPFKNIKKNRYHHQVICSY